jgi:hypothetical protein
LTGDFSAKLDRILGDPAMLAQIKALADTMTEGNARPVENRPEEPPEPKSPPEEKPASATPLSALPVLFSPSPVLEKNLKHTRDLLVALKPFLDERRCEKIDKMLSMMRLAEMAGQFGSLL